MGNHRAGRPDRSRVSRSVPAPSAPQTPGRPTGGKRKAERARAGRRSSLFPVFPTVPAPTVVGAAALMLAAGGAVTLGDGGAGSEPVNFSQASARTTSAVSAALTNRQEAVSRDSRRQALADAADADLQDAADAQSVQRDAALQKLAQSAQSYADEIAANLWVSPLPAGTYRMTARFGQYGLWASMHTGLDMAAPVGTPVRAVTSGVVTSVGYDGAYGNKTVITLADGTEIWYAHQNSYGVSVGQTVTPGQQIGEVGNTGRSTGPHLHMEVRPGAGDPVDPYAALVAHGVQP